MKMRCVLLLGGVVLLCVKLAMASNSKPGTALGGHSFAPQVSFCEGDFSMFNGICFFYEEPDNAEQQDISLGTPNVGTGIVDILEPDGVTLSDSLDFYLNSDGTARSVPVRRVCPEARLTGPALALGPVLERLALGT